MARNKITPALLSLRFMAWPISWLVSSTYKAQSDDLLLPRRQAGDCLEHTGELLAPRRSLKRRLGPIGQVQQIVQAALTLVHARSTPPIVLANLVAGDAEQPAGEGVVVAQLADLAKGLFESCGGQILGHILVGHAANE